MLIMTQERYR